MTHGYFRWALGVLVGLGAVSSHEAASQNWNGPDQVCVYEHANFTGWEQCYRVGEGIRDLGKRRNRVSSVRILGRARVTLFEYPDFQGNQVVVKEDVYDLTEWNRWNDQTDSLRVEGGGGFDGRHRSGRRGGGDRVCFYEHVEYQGRSQCFDVGADVYDLQQLGWNDRFSSIRLFGRMRIVAYEHIDFQGQRIAADQDIPDLTRINTRDGYNWNDRISSLRIVGQDWNRRRD